MKFEKPHTPDEVIDFLIEGGFVRRTHELVDNQTRTLIGEACLDAAMSSSGETESFWLLYETPKGETLLDERVAERQGETVTVEGDYEGLDIYGFIELAEQRKL